MDKKAYCTQGPADAFNKGCRAIILFLSSSYFVSLFQCQPRQTTAALAFYASSFTGDPLKCSIFSHHPWFFQVSWWVCYSSLPGCSLCACVCGVWKNGNRSFIAKSWEEPNQSLCQIPSMHVCLWLAKMEVHANTQPILYYFPFPYLYISQLSAAISIMGVQRSTGW